MSTTDSTRRHLLTAGAMGLAGAAAVGGLLKGRIRRDACLTQGILACAMTAAMAGVVCTVPGDRHLLAAQVIAALVCLTALAAWLLAESVTAGFLAGLAFVLLGIAVVNWERRGFAPSPPTLQPSR